MHLAGSSRQSEAGARVAELRRLLKRYKPAVAGFPWAVGDDRFSTMRELKRAYAGQEVQPLTGFDNGMVVYHRSVLDFFLVRRLSLFLLDGMTDRLPVCAAVCTVWRGRVCGQVDAWGAFSPGRRQCSSS